MQENTKGQNTGKNRSEDLSNENTMNEHQNASANRGGTTDMDDERTRGAAGNTSNAHRGSGIRTKRTVTGSDYDGQVAEE